MRSKSCLIICLLFLVLLISLVCYSRYYIPWKYLKDYRELVNSRADIKQIKAVLGNPNAVIDNKIKYNEWNKDFPFDKDYNYKDGEKVLVFYADPWQDGDGNVVYLRLDKNSRAADYELRHH